MSETQELLRAYAETGSEAAFREVVERYIDLVYSTARRWVGGDAHLAEDVAQTVFVRLSHRAGALAGSSTLGGWLHRDTCFVAGKTLRAERRRQAREREAAFMNSLNEPSGPNLEVLGPAVDQAINLLAEKERKAILLRFFERKDYRAIGAALGSNEDAARMRVNRALEKLQLLLKRRGVALSAAALGTLLTEQAVSAAPSALAGHVLGAVVAGGAATGATLSVTSIAKLLTMTKLQSGIVAALVIAGVGTSLVLYSRASARQRDVEAALQQQSAELARQSAENDRLAKLAHKPGPGPEEADLARLRSESVGLRQEATNLANLRRESQHLQSQAAQSSTPLQSTEEFMVKANFAKNWLLAFMMFSMDHQGTFPTNFDAAASFIKAEARAQTNVTTDQFELVYQGKLEGIPNPAETVVLREKTPWVNSAGKWSKVYGFGDGHVELHVSPDGNFDEYERAHVAPNGAVGK